MIQERPLPLIDAEISETELAGFEIVDDCFQMFQRFFERFRRF